MILTPHGKSSRRPAPPVDDAGAGVQIRCPRCQAPYTAQVINVIDVRRHPQLKAALLGGFLNRVTCPSCKATAVLNVPLIYHDPDKELLLVLAPSELNMPADQQQRLIGGLVQAVMSSVPAEERKGYFLRPQTILSRQHLIEQILEADGVTRDMLEAQRERVRLLDELFTAAADPARLETLVQENRAKLDYAFFAILTEAAQESEVAGDSQALEQLLALRDRLLQDPEIAQRLPQPLPSDSTLESALEKLLALLDDPEALAAMIVLNRPVFDYMFFQGLTAQLEQARTAGDTARAGRLATLRDRLLDEIEQQDKALRAAQQEDLRLIDEIVGSPDPQAAIRERLAQIDTLFLNTLGAALQQARQGGNIERSAKLETLQRSILSIVAESMPPEIRLINQLLGMDKAEDRKKALAESATMLSDDLEGLIEELGAETEDQGRSETARRLQNILREVQQMRAGRAPEQEPQQPET